MKQAEEKKCGNCCWFFAEDTFGYGCCPFQFGELVKCSGDCTQTKEFVSKGQMRHYMAVLLSHIRWLDDDMFIHYAPDGDEAVDAMKFAFKYMKIFSNL